VREIYKIKLENLTIEGHAGMLNYHSRPGDMLWMDRVNIFGPGMHDLTGTYSQTDHQWWTDTNISNSREGMATQFVRNCSFTNIGDDVMRGANFVVNVAVDNVDAGTTSWTPNVIAYPLKHDNRIYADINMTNLGNRVRAWPLEKGTAGYFENHDVIIDQCYTEQLDASTINLYLGADTLHFIVQNSIFIGKIYFRTSQAIPEEEQFYPHNVLFKSLGISEAMEEVEGVDVADITIL